MTKILEAKEMTKVVGTFKKERIVDSLSFSMEDGEVVGLLGPNGAGKTTTMKMFLGLTKITSGSAFIFGKSVPTPESRDGVGFMPEAIHHPDYLSVWEYVKYHARLNKFTCTADSISEHLERVGMLEFKDKLLKECSKGMRQRTDIARILLCNARIIFLDEPFSGLDPCGQIMLKEVISSLKKQNISVLINSHAVGILEDVCDRVCIMDKGKILVNDSLEKLLDTSKNLVRVLFESEKLALDFSEKFRDKHHKNYDSNRVEFVLNKEDNLNDFISSAMEYGGNIEKAAPLILTLDQLFVKVLSEKGTKVGLEKKMEMEINGGNS